MKNNKFEFLKNRKKEVIIISGIILLIVLGAIGWGSGFNTSDNKTNVATGTKVEEKADTNSNEEVKQDNEDKKEEDKTKESNEETKEEVKVTNEESEELKTDDTSNLSEEEKKDNETSTTNEENKDKSITSSSNADSSSEKANPSESEKSDYEKESEEMAKAFPSGSTKVMKEDHSENPMSIYKENTHNHTWVDITETVTHAEEGHWEEVVVIPEQVKEVPVYERKELSICTSCGADITADPAAHVKEQALKGNYACGGHRSEWKEVQTGTKQEVTPAVTEKKWIVDKPASTETKVVGKKCSGCGVTN